MSHQLTVVDAFTDRPFSGNPAAVAVLGVAAPDQWLQAVAAEMNLSETAYLREIGPGVWGLRWFTPAREVELCGHATLASAHVLWADGHTDLDTLRFQTLSGELTASRRDGVIWLDFPRLMPREIQPPDGLADALGVHDDIGVVVTGGADGDRSADLLVEIGSADAVRAVAPDMNALARLPYRGVIATSPGADGVDFVSRFFAPAYGIPEDPVTGSAHCLLAPFWAARLGKTTLLARQVSHRGGELRLELAGDDRVRIGGTAVTVARTQLVAGEA